jgi:lipopolysaccharide transport system ATP-binding protein
MNKGVYTVTVGIHSEEGLSYDWVDELVVFEVNNSIYCDGLIDLQSSVEFTILSNHALAPSLESI